MVGASREQHGQGQADRVAFMGAELQGGAGRGRKRAGPSRVLIYPRAKDGKGFGLVIIPFKLANQ